MTTITEEPKLELPSGEEIPTLCRNVKSQEQLKIVPNKFKTQDGGERPLQWCDPHGQVHLYALKPLTYSAIFILVVEVFERFCYNGLLFSGAEYLTGIYDPTWNANLDAVQASTFISTATALTYISPLLAGLIADCFLGDYLTIVLGSSLLYIPGLLLMALCAYPGLLGQSYNVEVLISGMLVLWPLGAGAIKSVVNIMAAKQYHPLLQKGMLENFFVYYYMALNIGALCGGVIVPLVAESNVGIAYTLPVCFFAAGLVVFMFFRQRYVRTNPNSQPIRDMFQSDITDQRSDSRRLLRMVGTAAMIIPFALVYFQLATVFVIQGTAMRPMGRDGWLDASMMNNLDALSVIVFGFLVSQLLYPFLQQRYDLTLPTTTKFAIGTGFSALSILCLILVDHAIRATYEDNGDSLPILWQTFSYVLVGAAKIFCFSAAYEVTFQLAPPGLKGLASSLMIFTSGAIPNLLSVGLYNAFRPWFPAGTTIEDYCNANNFDFYLWIIFGVTSLATLLLSLKPVRSWVETARLQDSELQKTDQSDRTVRQDSELQKTDHSDREQV